MNSFIKYDKFTCEFPIENLPYGVFSTKNDVSNLVISSKIKRKKNNKN